MGKVEKKILRLRERLETLESEMLINLKQKISATAEISISDYQRKIADIRKQITALGG